jgi:hypothetical protein
MIRSKQHTIYTVEMNKISLATHDDKRFILPNNVDTLPHGHYLIPRIKQRMLQNPEYVPNMDHIELDVEEDVPPLVESSEDESDSDYDI